MDTETVNIKTTADTRRKLKLLAALLDKNMMETLDQLVTEALAKHSHANPESLQVQNLPNE
jgi:phenylpyruvate tautomerase PptA (4-oxalocrotonate tautomerase family)